MDTYNGVEIKTLNELCVFDDVIKRPVSYGKKTGKYKFHTGSLVSYDLFTDTYDCDKLTIIIDADYSEDKFKIILDSKFSVSTGTITLRSKNDDEMMTQYIYLLLVNQPDLIERIVSGNFVRYISVENFKKIQIPVRSTEKQNHIVEYVNFYTKQIKSYEDMINMNRDSIKKLFDIKTNNESNEIQQNVMEENENNMDVSVVVI